MAALPRPHYQNVFEIGCSIGVLTKKLTARCENLLSVDYSEVGLAHARKRCRWKRQVRFERMEIPHDFPAEQFDLILFSEVGYYLSAPDLATTCQLILDHLLPGGQLLMVHWRAQLDNCPLNGDLVHATFFEPTVTDRLKHLADLSTDQYRMDLFERL